MEVWGERVLTAAHEERGEGHALGAHLVAENLDGQESLERSPADGVGNLEEVDPGEHGLRDGGGDVGGSLLVIAVLDVGDGGGDDDADPAETAHNVDGEQHGATADLVDDGGTETGEDDLDSVHAELDVHLRLLTLDTSGVKEGRQVVGDDAWGKGQSGFGGGYKWTKTYRFQPTGRRERRGSCT